MNNTQNELFEEFFQVFIKSINRTLTKKLDTEIYEKIQYKMETTSEINDIESLKENNALYKLDYATGNRQGNFVVLIPEELIASISDVLTGGTGTDSYKGSLSEIETNTISKILDAILKDIESSFKKHYEHDLAFSASAKLLLKEMPQYEISSEDSSFDLLITNTLSLNEGQEYKVNVITNLASIEKFMEDLGISKTGSSRQTSLSSLNIDCLSGVKINVTAELGRTQVPIKYALELVKGSLIELDTLNNADIKVFANGVEFAYAQVVAIGDNFGLKITKIVSPEERLEYI